MRPQFVDFHCHLDLYPDLEQAIAVCDASQTATLAVTTTPKAFPRNKELTASSEFVRAALGLHPQLVADRAQEIKLFEELLPQSRYVGEVGLDASPAHYRSFDIQKKVFRKILELCEESGDKILSVHSNRTSKIVLDMIAAFLPTDRAKVVLHWFCGSKKDVLRAIDMGCYFSVNEQMLNSPSGQRIIAIIPRERLLTETDGPFVERDGKPLGPGDVNNSVKLMAKVFGCEKDLMRKSIIKNLGKLMA